MARRTESTGLARLMQATIMATALGTMAGCGDRGSQGGRGNSAPTSPVEFATGGFVIDRLGQPVALPVVTGSSPSPETIYSSDEAIVSVNGDGTVQAHQNGAVEIRTRGGRARVLKVLVKAVSGIRIEPASSVLQPGEEVRLRVMASPEGDELPPLAIVWSTSEPAVGFARNGVLRASRPGTVKLRAQYGGAEATAEAKIQDLIPPRVNPPRARLKVGEVRYFRVDPQPAAAGTWKSSRSAVLVSRGVGLFMAVGAGRAKACNEVPGREVCSEVEVVR